MTVMRFASGGQGHAMRGTARHGSMPMLTAAWAVGVCEACQDTRALASCQPPRHPACRRGRTATDNTALPPLRALLCIVPVLASCLNASPACQSRIPACLPANPKSPMRHGHHQGRLT